MTYRLVLTRLLLTVLAISLVTACDKPGSDAPKKKQDSAVPKNKTTASPVAIVKSDKDDPRRKIETAIVHGLSLLNKKDMQAFVRTYMPPEFLQRIQKNSTIEKFTKSISKERKGIFRKSLTEAQNLKPSYNKARNRATIKLKAPSRPLSFIKVNDYWYIR